MSGKNGREGEVAETKLNTAEREELRGEILMELLEQDLELKELTFRRKREGKGHVYYLSIPAEWVRELGLESAFETKSSIKVKALFDKKRRALTVKFPETS